MTDSIHPLVYSTAICNKPQGQISIDAPPLTGVPCAAAEEHDQTHKIDRQTPGKLKKVEKSPGPASGGDPSVRTISYVVHMQNLFLFGATDDNAIFYGSGANVSSAAKEQLAKAKEWKCRFGGFKNGGNSYFKEL